MSSTEDAFDGVGGPRGLFPTDLPWTPEAGFVTERPPAQIEDAVARALKKTQQRAATPPEPSSG